MMIWAVGPQVMRGHPDGGLRYIHETPRLHRVYIEEIGGVGEPNAGEFLVSTPCGYKGWVPTLNKNPDERRVCEACLNERPTSWTKWPIPDGAIRKAHDPRTDPVEDWEP
jgi:hypothetical protein